MSKKSDEAYAIIRTGGKQYTVSVGDRVEVEKLDIAPGETCTFSEVLLVKGEGADAAVGAPLVEGASVTGTVLGEKQGNKIIVFKKKRRKGYKLRNGHRQTRTSIQIDSIQA
jgi:large subunit ribosomal protein L21